MGTTDNPYTAGNAAHAAVCAYCTTGQPCAQMDGLRKREADYAGWLEAMSAEPVDVTELQVGDAVRRTSQAYSGAPRGTVVAIHTPSDYEPWATVRMADGEWSGTGEAWARFPDDREAEPMNTATAVQVIADAARAMGADVYSPDAWGDRNSDGYAVVIPQTCAVVMVSTDSVIADYEVTAYVYRTDGPVKGAGDVMGALMTEHGDSIDPIGEGTAARGTCGEHTAESVCIAITGALAALAGE